MKNKWTLLSLALISLSALSSESQNCIDLSGKYELKSVEDNCKITNIVGVLGAKTYSNFSMGISLDLPISFARSVRAGNYRSFELKNKNCSELEFKTTAYQNNSNTGGVLNWIESGDPFGKYKWDSEKLSYEGKSFSNKTKCWVIPGLIGRSCEQYSANTNFSYSLDKSDNLVLNYYTRLASRKIPQFKKKFTTTDEAKVTCTFKKMED
jgi:hypothetical protein